MSSTLQAIAHSAERSSKLYDYLHFNQQFLVETEGATTFKAPKKDGSSKSVILACMDTRLVNLLPRAMNIKDGDAKLLKTAGAVISQPFGSVMRSIIVALHELSCNEVFVIGHHDCGMTKINPSHTIMRMLDSGIAPSTLETLEHAGIDVRRWLRGFDSVRQSVENSVAIIRKHPLVPSTVAVHGLIIDPKTGALELVVDGNKDLTYLAGMAEKAAAEARAAALGGYKGAMALAAAMAASSGAFTFSADPTAEAVAQSQRKQAADAALTSGGLMGSSGMGAAAGAGGSGAGASSSSSSATTVTPAAGGGGEGGAGSGSSSTTSSSSSGAFRSGSGLSASALGSSGGPSSGGSSGGAGMSGLFLRKISAPHQWPSHRDSLSDAFLSGSGISISVASPEAALAALGGGGGSGGRGSGGAGRAGGAAGAGAGAGNNVMIGDDEGGSFSPLHEFSDMSRRFSVAPVLGMADGTVCGEGDHGSEGMVTAVEASHHH